MTEGGETAITGFNEKYQHLDKFRPFWGFCPSKTENQLGKLNVICRFKRSQHPIKGFLVLQVVRILNRHQAVRGHAGVLTERVGAGIHIVAVIFGSNIEISCSVYISGTCLGMWVKIGV